MSEPPFRLVDDVTRELQADRHFPTLWTDANHFLRDEELRDVVRQVLATAGDRQLFLCVPHEPGQRPFLAVL